MIRAVRPGDVPRDAGVALLVVMLLLALLLTIVGEFAQAMRLEAVTATNFRSALTETWLAEAAYQRALTEILPDVLGNELDQKGILVFRRARLTTPKTPERLDIPLGSARLSYRLTDENARLNLNRASRDVLDRLFREAGVEKTDRDVILDSIQDWRDPNEEYRLHGAESEDTYLQLPLPYRSKNAAFDSITELLQVKGVTPALFNGTDGKPGLSAYVTAKSPGQVNLNTAPCVVLKAVGFGEAECTIVDHARREGPYITVPGQFGGRGLSTTTRTFRVEAEGIVGGEVRARITAILQRRADAATETLSVLEWSGVR